MNEPTPENNQNLDEMTRLTLRVIALEEIPEKIQNQLDAYQKLVHELSGRISVLEEVRKVQKEINQRLLLDKSVDKVEKTVKPLWSFWKK